MDRFEFNPQMEDIRTTVVENAFITHYMPKARGEYVKVYLYGLKCAALGQAYSASDIAKALDMTESDVRKAWKYWEDEHLVRTDQDGEDMNVEFMSAAAVLLIPEMAPPVKEKKRGPSRKNQEMFRELEGKLGRLLSHREQETILHWTKDYGFTTQTVILMVDDCIDRDKRSLNYWDTMADVYHDEGIRTYDELTAYIEKRNAVNRRNKDIMSYMGLYDMPSVPQRQMLDKWFNEYGMDQETIKKAIDETVKITRPSFDYVDRVLTAWHNGEPAPSERKSSSRKSSGKDTSMPDLTSNYDPDLFSKLFGGVEE